MTIMPNSKLNIIFMLMIAWVVFSLSSLILLLNLPRSLSSLSKLIVIGFIFPAILSGLALYGIAKIEKFFNKKYGRNILGFLVVGAWLSYLLVYFTMREKHWVVHYEYFPCSTSVNHSITGGAYLWFSPLAITE